MTEEYYFIEEVTQNLSDLTCDKLKASHNKRKARKFHGTGDETELVPKQSQELRLHEIEQQLVMAESRCNTLKGQVDYMKMLYNGMGGDEKKKAIKPLPKMRQPSPRRQLSIDVHNIKRKKNEKENVVVEQKSKDLKYRSRSEEVPSRDNELRSASNMSTVPQRDINSKTDASAAVKSINNIICGITNSVNRLTQLQVQIGSTPKIPKPNEELVGVQTIKCSPRDAIPIPPPPPLPPAAEKPYQIESESKESAITVKSKNSKKKKSKFFISKHLPNKQESAQSLTTKRLKVTAKHVEKKTKLLSAENSTVLQTKFKKRSFGKVKLVSSRTLMMKKSFNNENKNEKQVNQNWKPDNLIELYHNSAVKMVSASEDNFYKNSNVEKQPVEIKQKTYMHATVNHPNPPTERVVTTFETYKTPLTPIEEHEQIRDNYYKNYELPTIASKMKQVAKSYFDNFSFRTIPFVTAKSTSPSHNLGVNIQQVLSIIKGRKPVTGISPTLAYNIELAANKLGSRPLSALVSTLGSKMSNRVRCPMATRYQNYANLQEMAKEIPEETVEEMALYEEEDLSKVPEEAVVDKEKVWSVDPEATKEKCTCVPKQGVHFNDVFNKYTPDNRRTVKEINKRTSKIKSYPVTSKQKYTSGDSNQINQRERTLKEVLKNLHDEFGRLNDHYDELKFQVNSSDNNADSAIVNELENLERELQNKEDEITMVMSLYKEVLTLKQQVKMLKKRASQSTVVVSPYNRCRDYKDLNAAGHLTKLLRHIQQFQDTLKKPNA